MREKRLFAVVLGGSLAVLSLAAAYGANFLVTDSVNSIAKNEPLMIVGQSTYTGCGYAVGYKVEASTETFNIAVSTDLVIGSTITVSRQIGSACAGHSVYKFFRQGEHGTTGRQH